jgi:3-methyladenine DNA glycosylase AlkC
MTERKLMKDGFDGSAIRRISKALRKTLPDFGENFPDFSEKRFQEQALNGIEKLELKQRVSHLVRVLHSSLPGDFEKAAKTLSQIPPYWDRGDESDPLAGFAAWPLIDYVGEYGLGHPLISLELLKTLTPLFSAEFAIRPFIKEHFKLTHKHLKAWCKDPNEHVRRLVSEGTRPRLPWGQRLPQFIRNPQPVIELLERIKDDPSEYVRRSVANNLNDISKDNPELVIQICSEWSKAATNERKWIIRQATRSLVRAGNPEVFPLLGYTDNPKITIRNLRLDREIVKIGEGLSFSFDIASASKTGQSFILDYAVYYMKANKKTSPKVFKLKAMTLDPDETTAVRKTHSFKAVTTRKHYEGEHAIELLINGLPCGILEFNLAAPKR